MLRITRLRPTCVPSGGGTVTHALGEKDSATVCFESIATTGCFSSQPCAFDMPMIVALGLPISCQKFSECRRRRRSTDGVVGHLDKAIPVRVQLVYTSKKVSCFRGRPNGQVLGTMYSPLIVIPLNACWQVKRRGAPPGGGGLVEFSCPIVRELKPIDFTDPGLIKRIRGNAYCTKVSPQIANRVAESSRGELAHGALLRVGRG